MLSNMILIYSNFILQNSLTTNYQFTTSNLIVGTPSITMVLFRLIFMFLLLLVMLHFMVCMCDTPNCTDMMIGRITFRSFINSKLYDIRRFMLMDYIINDVLILFDTPNTPGLLSMSSVPF